MDTPLKHARIALIAAMANGRVIGQGQKIPWSLPADLAYFKKTTWGKPIIMGRKTFESIGRPLPHRRNIIITHRDIEIPGAEVVHSLHQALASSLHEEEVMIIGGSHLYRQTLSMATRLYLTLIALEVDGDVFFPEWDGAEWRTVFIEKHEPDERNPHAYQFVVLERV